MAAYHRSGNFRVTNSCKDTHKNSLTVLKLYTFPSLVSWNETTHAKKTWSRNSFAVFVVTMQLLANYLCTKEN